MKISKLLEDCIMFHKLTVFTCDAAEQQNSYMMGSSKNPNMMTIQKHVSRCEMMNGYIALLQTLQDSPLAAASTKMGNMSIDDATLAGVILATCHTEWRNLYKMSHKTISESTRSML